VQLTSSRGIKLLKRSKPPPSAVDDSQLWKAQRTKLVSAETVRRTVEFRFVTFSEKYRARRTQKKTVIVTEGSAFSTVLKK
jgi:hypothetical protein